MALEAWEIVSVIVIIIIILKPDIVIKVARSLGKALGEYRKGKNAICKIAARPEFH